MRRILLIILLSYLSHAIAAVFNPEEVNTLKANFIANITKEGSIAASPSKSNPDYYYDWIRDSAIAMGLIERWYEKTHLLEDKTRLQNYVRWSEQLQHQQATIPGQDILGEPKFYMNDDPLAGQPYAGPWGRPQNDGPALRAQTLIRFALNLLQENEEDYVRTHLYNNTLDTETMGVIKLDLEYTAHHWGDKNYDLWEEVYGEHFFNSMVQRKALLEGAALARKLHDDEASSYYQAQAELIKDHLLNHIDYKNNIVLATLPPHPGPQKTMELDSAVILGVLLGNTEDGLFDPEYSVVKNTVAELKKQYQMLYPINKRHKQAVLFGRYPGDSYDGYQNDGLGNPWYILTATVAEYYYTLADRLPATTKNRALINNYIQRGDQYLSLIKDYAPDMTLSEQINLETGVPQGASSLTWSYVSVLRALLLREELELKTGFIANPAYHESH